MKTPEEHGDMANRRVSYALCALLAAFSAVVVSGRSRRSAGFAAFSGFWVGVNLMVAGFHALAARGDLKMEYKPKP